MQYRYRVVGKATQPFILRGAYFAIGRKIEFYIAESELDFVKERCELEKIEDLQKTTETNNSVSKNQEKAQNKHSTAQGESVHANTQPKSEFQSKRQYTRRNSDSDK